MKVTKINDIIIVFLNKFNNYNLDKDNFKDIIKILEHHNIKVKGYYDAYIYKDNNYGIVIELIESNLGYDDFNDIIDMRVVVKNTNFLYKIDDLIPIKGKYRLYSNKDLYMEIIEIDDKNMAYLIENSQIIYKDTNIIKKYSRVLKEYML